MSDSAEDDSLLREIAAAPGYERPLVAGEIVAGRFVVERLARAGGMGAVYRAVDGDGGQPVAVKVLHRHDDVARFEQEADLLVELRHPRVVRHVAHGVLPRGRPFLVMEWLDGEDLADRLRRAPLDAATAIALVRQAAEGLAVAHERGIVHRDVKPSNLFLPSGDAPSLRVLDFGVARRLSAPRAVTRTGATVGTVGYMAPEQAVGAADVDARADVFALGCVLFECLSGRPAFTAEHPVAILAKVLRDEVPRLATLSAGIPEHLDDLVAAMLAKERGARPADAAAVLAALDRLGPLDDSVVPRGRLGGAERQVVSVILAQSETPEDPGPLAIRYGAEVARLADGTLLLTLAGRGSATDQAARAASLALAVAGPRLRAALATGRADTVGRHPVGPAIDRGAALLDGPLGEVRVDDVTSALLDAGFAIEGGVLKGRRGVEAVRTLLGKPSPFVGRETEMAILEATLAECVREPTARAVLVTGAPGMGKSRLRWEFVEHARQGGAAVWMARAEPIGAGSQLAMAKQLVRSGAALREGDPADAQQAALRSQLQPLAPPGGLARWCEFLGEFVGAPPSTPSAALVAARADAVALGVSMRQAFEEWLAAACASRPLVIVLEDLHWGDAGSIAYVDDALRRCRDQPLLVLALGRPEVRELFPSLGSDGGAHTIALGGLSRRAAERLVRAVLGDHVAAEQVTRVVLRADGNAYYLEELIRSLAEGSSDELPETILAMVESRLRRLEPDARRVLRAASVFGEVFWQRGVATLLGGDRSTEEWLRVLVERELVLRRAGVRFPGEAELAFRHGLLRDACYATLTDADRRLAHKLAGEWLEAAGEKDALVLADHFELGGEAPRAVTLLGRAAQTALTADRPEQVRTLCQRGIAAGARGEDLGRFHILEGQAHAVVGDWRPVLDQAARAMALLPQGSTEWFSAAASAVFASTNLGDPGGAIELVRAVGALPVSPGISGPYGFAMQMLITGLVMFGEIGLARQFCAQFEEVAARGADPVFGAWVCVARTYVQIYGDEDLGGAQRSIDEVLPLATISRRVRSSADIAQSKILLFTGRFAEAERLIVESAPRWDASARNIREYARYFHCAARIARGVAPADEELRALVAAGGQDALIGAMSGLAVMAADHFAGRRDRAASGARAIIASSRFGLATPIARAMLARMAVEDGRWQDAIAATDGGDGDRGVFPPAASELSLCRILALREVGRMEEAAAALTKARARLDRIAAGLDPAVRASFLAIEANARALSIAGSPAPGRG